MMIRYYLQFRIRINLYLNMKKYILNFLYNFKNIIRLHTFDTHTHTQKLNFNQYIYISKRE